MSKHDHDTKHVRLFFLLLGAVIFLYAQKAGAQAESCLTGNCHATLGKDAVVHSPVKDGCTTCHQVTVEAAGKSTKHPGNLTITLSQNGADLCYMCHEPKNKKKTVHAPIMGGDCTSCHNPHGSPNKAMMKEVMPKVCFSCHPESMVQHKVMHPPVAAGDCASCHDNHQSDYPNRLLQEGNALCFTCHPDKEDGIKTKKTVHPPVKQSCTLCHNPHGSANKAMLIDAVPGLCSTCHPNESALAKKAISKHGPMYDAKSCMNCHDPHFSDQRRLLPAVQIDLCLGCHNKELTAGQGAIIDMKAFLAANKDRHGPTKSGDCVACHNPHGSDYWRILVKYYPSDFYTAFSEGKYALCFSCHDKAAFTDMSTTKKTNFRDGSRNLHFLHVNKSEKGRTCRSCHEVHATAGSPVHMKETLEFGGWKMPIDFTKNTKGGSCAPGCHGEKQYTR